MSENLLIVLEQEKILLLHRLEIINNLISIYKTDTKIETKRNAFHITNEEKVLSALKDIKIGSVKDITDYVFNKYPSSDLKKLRNAISVACRSLAKKEKINSEIKFGAKIKYSLILV